MVTFLSVLKRDYMGQRFESSDKAEMRDDAGPAHWTRDAGLCPGGCGDPAHSSPASIRKDSSAC